jgi:hypothetical protein
MKSKRALVGVVAAMAAAVLLVAGVSVTATQGAGTDGVGTDGFTGAPQGAWPSQETTPPQSPSEPSTTAPVEQPVAGTTDPTGGAGANGAGPANLPNAGFGPSRDGGNDLGALMAIIGGAGLALVGAGAAVRTSKGRNDA